MTYRYTYHNKLYHAMGGAHGLFCNPVRDARGKCIIGRGSQLVDFHDGARCVVIRRCLRLHNNQMRLRFPGWFDGAPVRQEARVRDE